MAIYTKVGVYDSLKFFPEEIPELMKDFIQPVSNIASEDERVKVVWLFPLVMECAKVAP